MQTALLTFATAVILAIAAAFAAPLYVDWTQWRPYFEAQAARTLGAPVLIRGPIEAELLPLPKLVLRDVAIGAEGLGTGVTIAELRGSFSLGALMKGEFAAEQIRLERPKIRLVLDATGKVALPAGARSPAGFNAAELTIRDGSLDVLDRATGRAFNLTGIDLSGEVGGPTGPVRLEGEVLAGTARRAVKLSLGAFAADAVSRARLSIADATPTAKTTGGGSTRPTSLFEADGTLRLAGGQPAFEGRTSYSASALTETSSSLLRAGWRLTGSLRAAGETAELQDLALTIGTGERPLELAGTARLGPVAGAPRPNAPLRLDVTLGARQLDLNTLTAGASPIAAFTALAKAIAPFGELTAQGALNLSSETLLIGGAPVREMKAEFGWANGSWQVRSLAAKLPGRSTVQLSGRMPRSTAESSATAFAGDLAIEIEDPAALAGWAAPELVANLAGLPAGSASLKGSLSADPARIALDNLALGIGPLRLSGSAGYAFAKAGDRARVDARLKGSEIDLDPLLSAARRAIAASRNSLDIGLTFDGSQIRIAGLNASGLELALKSNGQGVSFERLSLNDFNGLNVTGTGRVQASDQLDGTFETRIVGDTADGLAALSRFLGVPGIDTLSARLGTALAPVDLNVAVTTNAGRSDVSANGRLGAVKGSAQFALGGGRAGKVALDIEDGSDLLTRLGVPGLRPKLGPARLDATLAPDLDARLQLAGSSLTARGSVTLDAAGTVRPAAQLTLSSADLGRLFPAAAAAAEGGGPLAASLAGDLKRPDATWRIENLAGTLAGVKLEGGLGYSAERAQPLDVDLKLERWSLGRLLALTMGRSPGNTPWPDGRLTAAPLPDLAGALNLAIGRFDLPIGLPMADTRLRGSVNGGTLSLDSFSGKLAGGAASGTFRLSRRGDSLSAEGHLALAGADLSTLLAPLSARPAVDGSVTLGIDLAGAGRTPAQLVASLAGQGSLAVDEFSLAAVDPRSLQYVMLATERGVPPDAKRLGQLVNEALARGPLLLPRVETSLSILNGLVRTGTARVGVGSQRFAFDGSVDLARLTLEASVEMDDDADPRATAPPGLLVQWRGALGAPDRRFDAAALSAAINMRALERETKRLEAEYGRSPVMDAGHSTEVAPEPPPRATPPVPSVSPAVPVAPKPAAPKPQLQPRPQVQQQPQPRRPRPDETGFGNTGLVPPLAPPITIGPDRPPASVPQ